MDNNLVSGIIIQEKKKEGGVQSMVSALEGHSLGSRQTQMQFCDGGTSGVRGNLKQESPSAACRS